MSRVKSGVAIVHKPSGPTSHDIVAQARRLFGTRAIGHAGTLDPMASGVLLLLVGEATKLSSALTLDRKSYRATIRFGIATDSDDALGTPTSTRAIVPGWLTRERLMEALEAERRRLEQLPPTISAIKQAGVPAYRRQRRGEVVALQQRRVEVFDLSLLNGGDDTLELSMTVSKGYYVRALARDLGVRLSMPAHLAALCRTRSGCFGLEEAAAWPCSAPPPLLTLGEAARRCVPIKVLLAEGVRRARLGQAVLPEHFANDSGAVDRFDDTLGEPHACAEADGACREDDGLDSSQAAAPLYAWLDESGSLVALDRGADDGTSRVVRGFNDEA